MNGQATQSNDLKAATLLYTIILKLIISGSCLRWLMISN